MVSTSGGGIVAAFIGADGLWPASGWSLLWGGGGDTMNGVSAVDLNGDGRVDVAAAAVSGALYRLLQQPRRGVCCDVVLGRRVGALGPGRR